MRRGLFGILIMVFGLGIAPSRAQTCTKDGPYTCPPVRCFNRPLFLTAALADRPDPVPPSIVDICPPPSGGNPCVVPPSPLRDTSFPVGAQEMTFKAEIPTASICPKEIWWTVEYKEGTTWIPLYSVLSPDAREYEFTESGKSMTRFGATGLRPGKEHRVSVAYCCGVTISEVPSCTCNSDPSYDGTDQNGSPVGFVPGAFRGGIDLPAIPAAFASTDQENEDTFHRAKTRSKRDPNVTRNPPPVGDGLGPDSVWLDSNAYYGAGNGARISDSGAFALFPQGAIADYAVEATNSHAFAEILFGKAAGAGIGFNVDLRARRFSDGSTVRFYFVKFAQNHRGAGNEPQLTLNVTPCPPDDPLPTDWLCQSEGLVSFGRMGLPFTIPTVRPPGLAPEDPNYNCFGAPVLAPGSDNRVWLGIEVVDDELFLVPHVYARVGWSVSDPSSSCSPSGDISRCERSCVFDVLDLSGAAGVMSGNAGMRGLDMRDLPYKLFVFRSGSKP